MMYARYRPTVQIEVMAKYANGTPSALPQIAGIVMIRDAVDTAITAYNGTRCRLRRRNSRQPGMPRSRENAYHVRDALVSPAAPQKSWPIVAIRTTIFAAHMWLFMALVKIEIAVPPAPLTAFTSWAA